MKIKKEDIVWMIRQELKNLLDSYDQERTPGQEEGTEWFNEQPSKDDEQEELQEDEFVPGRSRRTEMKQTCNDYGYYDLPRLLNTMNSIQLASKGQYGKPPKGGK
jgi:hypothetical protein|tara:strand:+ start:310 stop:624 length:315 start_codon:yes stop_codon:yes gene_type:complete